MPNAEIITLTTDIRNTKTKITSFRIIAAACSFVRLIFKLPIIINSMPTISYPHGISTYTTPHRDHINKKNRTIFVCKFLILEIKSGVSHFVFCLNISLIKTIYFWNETDLVLLFPIFGYYLVIEIDND